MRYRDVPRAEGFDGRSVQGSRERERNSLAPPTLDIYLPLSNLSLYDAVRDMGGEAMEQSGSGFPPPYATFVLVGH